MAQDKNFTLHLYVDGIQPGLLNEQVAPKQAVALKDDKIYCFVTAGEWGLVLCMSTK